MFFYIAPFAYQIKVHLTPLLSNNFMISKLFSGFYLEKKNIRPIEYA